MNNDSVTFFRMIRDFLGVFMTNQKGASDHTVRSYRQTLNQLLDYLSEKIDVKKFELSFNDISIGSIEGFLDYGEMNLN